MLSCLVVAAAAALWAPQAVSAQTSRRRTPPGQERLPRAPSGPPLTLATGGGPASRAGSATGSAIGEESAAGEGFATSEEATVAPAGGQDLLAGNGLDSPSCRQQAELAPAQRSDCQADQFTAAPYPTDSYMFDVNVDTGVGKWSNDASALLQNLTQLGWMALVSLTRGLVVMLEWCYSLGASTRALMGQVAERLHAVGADFTQPLLAVALSLLAALAAYRGLIRRRVAESATQALTALAMMAVGLWLVVDPLDTVGALQRLSDEAGAGTLAAVAAGTPGRPTRTLADGLGQIFDASVTAPWCYMEFGSVDWCQAPEKLDRRLRAAALRTAAELRSQARCRPSCGQADDMAAQQARRSIALLGSAQTNGEIFLALPAEGPLRNSAKDDGTLLNVLCGGGPSASSCGGPTASQAEFRSERGTYGRAIGLLWIWIGGLGMLLLFGLLAVRLLLSGLLTIGYLLIAPAAVLAPALGDRGQAAFRTWLARLLMAAGSKLVYSFLLGTALLATSLALHLAVLGWWAQWLLVSAFWWTAFLKRHETFGFVPVQPFATRRGRAPRAPRLRRRPLVGVAVARALRTAPTSSARDAHDKPPLALLRTVGAHRSSRLSVEAEPRQSDQERARHAAARREREAEKARQERVRTQLRERRRQEAESRKRTFERFLEAIPEASRPGLDERDA